MNQRLLKGGGSAMAETTSTKPMVIVGGGTAAATLRQENSGRPVVIISGEPLMRRAQPSPWAGRELEDQKVLLATGGQNRRLQIPRAELAGIHYLRTVAECGVIKREAVAGRAAVVGMGFICYEVAASLRVRAASDRIFSGSRRSASM